MSMWEFIIICGIVFVILELFIPSMFFLNFALAAFLTAIISLVTTNSLVLVLTFFILSFISFIFLRPLLLRRYTKNSETGIKDKYIGRTAKATEDITPNSGAISIYDERWEARTDDKSTIPAGSEVKILKNDSLVMFVKKLQ